MATLDFSTMVDPDAPVVAPAGEAAATPASTPQDKPEAPKADGSIFSADLFKDASIDLAKAPLAGVERAGRGIVEVGRAVAGAVGINTPALPPPYFEEPKAFPAQLVSSATQFGIGWVAGGAITKGLGIAAKVGGVGSVADDVIAQGIGTTLVADPHAPNLANLVEQFPVLQNPITEYLSTKEDDSIAFGKFKSAVSDMAAQLPLSLITKVVRGMKAEKVGDVKTADAMKAEVAQETGLAPKPTIVEAAKESVAPAPKPEAPHIEVKNHAGKPVFSITKEQADLFDKQVTAKVRSGNTEDLVHDLYSMVNHENMDSQQTVQQVVVAMSNIIKKPLDAAGIRTDGVMTNKMTSEAADILGQDPAQYLAKLRVMAQNADDMPSMIAAGNGYIQAFADDISSIANKINFGAASPEDELRMALHINSFAEVLGLHASLRTGAARATQAGNIRTGLGANVNAVADALEAAGGSDAIRQVAKRIALAGKDRKAVVQTLEASWGRKLLDTHNEFWINGILSGVKTHVINVTSNTVNTLATPFNQMVGHTISKRDTRGIKEGIAMYRGLATQFKDSMELAVRAFKTDTAILDPARGTNELWGRAISSANYKMDETSFMGQGVDLIGKIIRFPGRFLTAEDEFFKQINYRAKLKVNLSNEAEDLLNAGKLDRAGVEKYVEDRFQAALSPAQQDKDALAYARQSTFTQPLRDIETHEWLGNIGASIQETASKHPILRGTILPFIKVPTNIMRSAVDHSLLAPFTKRFHAALAAGGERANLAKGRLATGTLLATGISILAIEGHITGAAYGDKDMQARQRESGWQPYSVTNGPQAGKDQWFVSLSRLDPWGTMIGLIGDFYQTSQHLDEGARHDYATALALSLANNIANKSYLQGLVEISSIMGTGYNKEHAVERFIQQRLGSYVPAYTNLWTGNEDVKALRHWYDGALAKIPGYSSSVEARRDYLSGEKTVAPDGHPWNALNPFTVSKTRGNAVRDELRRLTLSSAESKFAPPDVKLGTIDLANIRNAKGQSAYDRWTELIGQVKVHGKTFEENLYDLMQTPRYKYGTDGTSYYTQGSRPAMIGTARKNHEDLAQRMMLKEFTDAKDADGVPVDLRKALQTDSRNKTAERYGKADKLQDISNLQ